MTWHPAVSHSAVGTFQQGRLGGGADSSGGREPVQKTSGVTSPGAPALLLAACAVGCASEAWAQTQTMPAGNTRLRLPDHTLTSKLRHCPAGDPGTSSHTKGERQKEINKYNRLRNTGAGKTRGIGGRLRGWTPVRSAAQRSAAARGPLADGWPDWRGLPDRVRRQRQQSCRTDDGSGARQRRTVPRFSAAATRSSVP